MTFMSLTKFGLDSELSKDSNVSIVKGLASWLGENRLGNIPRAALRGLTQLKELSLSSNGIESMDAGVLEGVPNLTALF
ncbi:hypothetical protein DPMN_020835 [Dreissena polymorpha]|uniref:Uncharacterized protein n=1 Tax=Dreissena polymorpha TaxID=45954 RepID=A0A9D4SBD0_DREPO|nr:hypothetical protein DPMN_020835 [Dreissena polymorpha]